MDIKITLGKGVVTISYQSYKLRTGATTTPRDKMRYDKKKQIEYLYNLAADSEDNCLLNGEKFSQSPRIYNRLIKTNYYQSLNMETINDADRFKSGDLLSYDDDEWICTSSFVFHGLYCKGNFIRTNYTLRWLNADKEIIERRCYIVSASQYNSGEEGNKTIVLGYNQYMIVLPSDSETNVIDRTLRIFIDKNTEKPTPYRVTRNDTVPYSDWDRGCVCLVVTEEQYNDKTDSIKEWLCDYDTPSKPTEPIEITCVGKPQIRSGGTYKTFAANSQNKITWELNILDTQRDFVELVEVSNNQCKLRCKRNDSLIGTVFKLIASINGENKTEILITVVGGV